MLFCLPTFVGINLHSKQALMRDRNDLIVYFSAQIRCQRVNARFFTCGPSNISINVTILSNQVILRSVNNLVRCWLRTTAKK